ncbi:MAG: hypothetical protein LKI59_08860 [Bacteroidales bacterium]|jgi:cellulose synthase/poly-beta-1,6-N-acetylglucosamine synthase-like glycosyltransferase|nr:hypothetical protein [Bacteroidales bacterium]
METKNELTAEQGFRLINETLASNRRSITKRNGSYFILWGGLLTVVSLAVLYLWKKTDSPIWNLLWFALPVIGYPLAMLLKKNKEKIPMSLISSLLRRTWSTFGIFALTIGLLSALFTPMNISLAIILLFGFTETISGVILKNWPIIIAGFITGIVGSIYAAKFSSDCNQMLIFTVAGFILALTGLYIRIIKK